MNSSSSNYKDFQQYLKTKKAKNYIQNKDEQVINEIVNSQTSFTTKQICENQNNTNEDFPEFDDNLLNELLSEQIKENEIIYSASKLSNNNPEDFSIPNVNLNNNIIKNSNQYNQNSYSSNNYRNTNRNEYNSTETFNKTSKLHNNNNNNSYFQQNKSYRDSVSSNSNIGSNLKTFEKKLNIKFQLISKTAVIIEANHFIESSIMNNIKENGGKYDRENKYFVIPYIKYIETFKAIKGNEKSKDIDIHPISDIPIEITQKSDIKEIKYKDINGKTMILDYSKEKNYSLNDIPSNFFSKMYNFQKEGVEFALKRKGRILLADEMGVGKTTQAIGVMSIFKDDWPVLIVTPASLKYNWKNEILMWLSELNINEETHIHIIKKASEDFKESAKFFIVSYDLCWRIEKKIIEKGFKFVICDEAHYLKSKDAKRTKIMTPILTKCKRLLFLSGTPILSKPIEIFNLVRCLRPDIFKSLSAFSIRYCDQKQTNYGIDRSGSSNPKELNYILSHFMIRRLKKDVLSELPHKRRQKVEIQTDNKIIRQIGVLLAKTKKLDDLDLTTFKKNVVIEDDKEEVNDENDNDDSLNTFNKAYKLTGEAKLKGICEYLTDLIENKCKFLVFAHHLDILDSIEDVVKKSEIKYVRIDGSTKNEQRQFNVDTFQKDEQCLIAILSITACATGITMTKASTVVFAEMYFTPAVMIQAEDRAHRIGQEHTCVNIHYLYGPNTLDELIYQKLLEKHFIVTETLDNKKLVMDIEKLTNGRIGDFEVRINNPNNEESSDDNNSTVSSQLVMKKLQKKGSLKIEDYFEKNKKNNIENKSKMKKLDKITETSENDEDLTKFMETKSKGKRSISREREFSDDEYTGGKKYK